MAQQFLTVNVGGMFRTLYEIFVGELPVILQKKKDSKIKDSLFCVRNCELAKRKFALYSYEWACGAESAES